MNNTYDQVWEMLIMTDELQLTECEQNLSCLQFLIERFKEFNEEMAYIANFEKILVSVIYGLFLLFGLIGNILVIATVTLSARSMTPTGVDVINPCLLTLASADLLIILLVIPIRVL